MTTETRPLTLHLVRHGETAWNAERRFQTPDVPLSDTGREQARAVAETLAGVSAGLVLASDYARTLETADIIATRLALPVLKEPALRERNFGVARGRLYAEIGAETLAQWRNPRVRIEQGESWADVFDRVAALFARLRAAPPAGEMILVTHGGTMNVILQHLQTIDIDAFELAPLENCALRTVVLDGA